MKTYEVYRNIRKRAEIIGLPIPLFALMMTSVIGSLLFMIFSFSLMAIGGVLVWNVALFIGLTHFAKHPAVFHLKKVFPKTISNKRDSLSSHYKQ